MYLCNVHEESLTHLFCHCSYIINEIVPFAPTRFLPTVKECMFNVITEDASQVTNLLFLVAKYHVYRMRCAQKLPSVSMFKKEILLIRDIEKYNARVNNKMEKHFKKWYNINLSPDVEEIVPDEVIRDYIDKM